MVNAVALKTKSVLSFRQIITQHSSLTPADPPEAWTDSREIQISSQNFGLGSAFGTLGAIHYHMYPCLVLSTFELNDPIFTTC